MKTKLSRLGFCILLMAFAVLAVAAVAGASEEGGGVVVAQRSESEALGYVPVENMIFQLQSGWKHVKAPSGLQAETLGKRMTKIEFYLGDKTLLVQAGRDELYIKGFTTGTGGLAGLTANEKMILKSVLEKSGSVELGENTDLFLNSLNVLCSWPESVPVFFWNGGDDITYAVGNGKLAAVPYKEFVSRNTEAIKVIPLNRQAVEQMQPPVLDMNAADLREPAVLQGWTRICGRIGHLYTGRYFKCTDFLGLCLERRYINYTHLVGGRSCFGRCGAGCSGVPQGKLYTRDCFNHDACVTRLGRTAMSCNIMFAFCIDDVLNAPKCR